MSEHTPTPWEVEGPTSAIVSTCKMKGGRFHVADMRGWGHLTGKGHGALGLGFDAAIAIQEANAALIVKAVNNHDEAIEIIEALLGLELGSSERAMAFLSRVSTGKQP